jgi:hypothetical protein
MATRNSTSWPRGSKSIDSSFFTATDPRAGSAVVKNTTQWGIKTEHRSRPTRIVGQRFFIYASKRKWRVASGELRVKQPVIDNIVVPHEALPPWMIELAEALILGDLPTGVIVGSAVIEKVSGPVPLATGNAQLATAYEWFQTEQDIKEYLRAREKDTMRMNYPHAIDMLELDLLDKREQSAIEKRIRRIRFLGKMQLVNKAVTEATIQRVLKAHEYDGPIPAAAPWWKLWA